MSELLLRILESSPCPVIGLDPGRWDGVALVETEKPLPRARQIQLTYFDDRHTPQTGLAVQTIRWHPVMDDVSPPNWLVNFVARFDGTLIEARARSGVDPMLPDGEFEINDVDLMLLGRPARGVSHAHRDLPLRTLAFFVEGPEHCRVIVGSWRLDPEPIVPELRVVDAARAPGFIDLAER